MTSVQVPSRISIKRPFAENGDLSTIADADGILNYPQGFTSAYSNPASDGGQYLKRSDLNALGNIATNDLFRYKCGGLNTFDVDFAIKVGGYPKGAVLKFLNGNYVYDVISLIDNNMIDFTGATPTAEQISAGIAVGSVDGSSWAYCNREASSSDSVTIFTAASTSYYFNATAANAPAIPLGCFMATKSGPLIPDVEVSVVASATGEFTGTSTESALCGFGLIVYDLGTSMSGYEDIVYPKATSLGDWKLIYSNNLGTSITHTNVSCSIGNIVSGMVSVNAQYGHYYVFSYFAGNVSKTATATTATGATIINTGTVTTEISKLSVKIY